MTIRHFSGEFLVHPTPLHLDLNRCSHTCRYCYSSLSERPFKLNWKDLQNTVIKGKSGQYGKSISKWLINEGYPVLVSNSTDPFAKSNINQFKAVKDFLDRHNVRLCYQTKGGPGSFGILSEEKPTYVYISLTSDRKEITEIIEPNAPNYQERLSLIEICVQAGHDVVVGLNPFVSDWWKEIPIKTFHKIGVKKLYIQSIHISAKAAKKTHASFSPWVDYAKSKKKYDYDKIKDLVDIMSEEFLVYAFQYGHYFPEGYFKDYPHKKFPIIEDFFRLLDNQQSDKPISFDAMDVFKWLELSPPFEASDFKSYLQNWGMQLRRENNGKDPKVRNYHQVLQHMLNIDLLSTCFRHESIAYQIDDNKKNIVQSDTGGPILVWDKNNNESYGYIDYKETVKYNGPFGHRIN